MYNLQKDPHEKVSIHAEDCGTFIKFKPLPTSETALGIALAVEVYAFCS